MNHDITENVNIYSTLLSSFSLEKCGTKNMGQKMYGGKIIASGIKALQGFALLIAAIVHDYRHKGVNNNYLVKVRSTPPQGATPS